MINNLDLEQITQRAHALAIKHANQCVGLKKKTMADVWKKAYDEEFLKQRNRMIGKQNG